MKALIAFVVICGIAAHLVVANADWIDAHDAYMLHNDGVTACQPPRNTGEKLVATLRKSADGGPLTLHCTYHADMGFAP
jgi:hypothetical protein